MTVKYNLYEHADLCHPGTWKFELLNLITITVTSAFNAPRVHSQKKEFILHTHSINKY